VDEARLRPDNFRKVGEEGDHVVPGDALDLVDPGDVEDRLVAFLAHRLRRLPRRDAELGHGVEGVRLDLEPDAETGLRRPDRRHFRARVAGDQGLAFRLVLRAVGDERGLAEGGRRGKGAGKSLG